MTIADNPANPATHETTLILVNVVTPTARACTALKRLCNGLITVLTTFPHPRTEPAAFLDPASRLLKFSTQETIVFIKLPIGPIIPSVVVTRLSSESITNCITFVNSFGSVKSISLNNSPNSLPILSNAFNSPSHFTSSKASGIAIAISLRNLPILIPNSLNASKTGSNVPSLIICCKEFSIAVAPLIDFLPASKN